MSDARAYRRRLRQLAAIYAALFALAISGVGVLLVHARLFVTLSQRSNVETLTLAFFLLFFTYVAVLSSRGAVGSVRIVAYRLRHRLARDGRLRRRELATQNKPGERAAVAVNLLLERAGHPNQPFELQIADAAGPVGRIRVDGVRIDHHPVHRDGSNNLLSYFVRQVSSVLGQDPGELEIVCWKSIDDEDWYKYVAMVASMRLLAQRMGNGAEPPPWPRLTLSAEQCSELERRMGEICETLREEAFLPHLEYEGEHKIPIIPEPLGILSLSRRERRVDSLSSMSMVLAIVVLAVALFLWFALRPPWVPGS